MKKILALVLAGLMVLGMAATGFAANIEEGDSYTDDLAAIVSADVGNLTLAEYVFVFTADVVVTKLGGNLKVDHATVDFDDFDPTLVIDFISPDEDDDFQGIAKVTYGGRAVKISDGTETTLTAWSESVPVDVTVVGPTKDVNSLENGDVPTDFADDQSLAYGVGVIDGVNYSEYDEGRGSVIPLEDLIFSDEANIEIDLYEGMFNENAGKNPIGSSVVRENKISARTQIAAGSSVIKETVIDYDKGAAFVKVDLIDKLATTSDVDFNFTTYLMIDGKRKDRDGEGVNFIGTIKNEVISVYSDDDFVDISLGEVAEAIDFVDEIEVDLGNGVSIWTSFFKGKKYYGVATREPDAAADRVFADQPDVDNVVILETIGLNSTADYVNLDTDDSDYYVYDKDLNYLGRGDDDLKFSSRYYLANKELTTVSDSEPVDEEPGEDFEAGAGTGGDAAPSNANSIPGTGF